MYNIKKHWYILQTFSGFENRTVKKIKKQIELNNIEYLFGDILVPGEKVIEIKNGEKKNSECKFFPGYILINMYINNKSWNLIKNIPKVVGFIGGKSDKPSPLKKTIIKNIIDKINKLGNKPRPKVLFNPGETVRVNNGPFSSFEGIVETVDYGKNRLKVSVLIFGRSTPVELSFHQVEKNI